MGEPVQPSVWERVQRLAGAAGWRRLWVGYSGGADSEALLWLLASAVQRPRDRLRAVHVIHHLHPDCRAWAEHCVARCAALGVPLDVREVRVGRAGGLEAAAREARYQAWSALLGEGDLLCTAHHREDQAETVLLRLLRGSGMDGLAGMPARRRLGQGWLLRPLLDLPRERLRAVNAEAGVVVIEDPANQDLGFDRVFVRRRVLPLLAERWPAVVDTLVGLGAAAGESATLSTALARVDGLAVGGLDCQRLRQLDPARQANLVRAWLRAEGLRPPGRRFLRAGLLAMLGAGVDRQPEWVWGGGVVRRHRDRLYAEPPEVVQPPGLAEAVQGGPRPLSGEAGSEQQLALGHGLLRVSSTPGCPSARVSWLRVQSLREGLYVDQRRPGERCRLASGVSRRLKDLLRESGMLPWWRERWPVLRDCCGEVLAVPGVCVAHRVLPAPGDEAVGVWFEPRNCAFPGDLLPLDSSDQGSPAPCGSG
jgi:tRNA(Ile)-lysidine synthase